MQCILSWDFVFLTTFYYGFRLDYLHNYQFSWNILNDEFHFEYFVKKDDSRTHILKTELHTPYSGCLKSLRTEDSYSTPQLLRLDSDTGY